MRCAYHRLLSNLPLTDLRERIRVHTLSNESPRRFAVVHPCDVSIIETGFILESVHRKTAFLKLIAILVGDCETRGGLLDGV